MLSVSSVLIDGRFGTTGQHGRSDHRRGLSRALAQSRAHFWVTPMATT